MHTCTATPDKPQNVTGNIQNTTSATGAGNSVVTVDWLPPENQNDTAIDYYELTLNGSNSTSTTLKIDAAASLPYYLNVTFDNYKVSVTAVDVCGQKSEPSEFVNVTSDSSETPSAQCITCIQEQKKLQKEVNSFRDGRNIAIVFCVLIILAAIIIVVVFIAIIVYRKRHIENQHDVPPIY